MRSVADGLRQRDREEFRKLSFQERLSLVFELGEADLALFCRAQGLDRETAIRLLQRRRQAGRTPSKCISALIG
jgi:CRP-like cAMP-binding protein